MNKIFIYPEDLLDIAYDHFCSLIDSDSNQNDVKLIKEWLNSNEPLSSYYKLEGYSKACECFYLTENIIVKTGTQQFIEELIKEINSDIIQYIVPTVIVKLNKKYPFSKEHIDFRRKNCTDMKENFMSDCIIFQPKVDLIQPYKTSFYEWLKETNIIKTTKDLNELNVGYWNGKPAIFDW